MRSLLFIPADDEKKLGKGVASGADALILDLEDCRQRSAQGGGARGRGPVHRRHSAAGEAAAAVRAHQCARHALLGAGPRRRHRQPARRRRAAQGALGRGRAHPVDRAQPRRGARRRAQGHHAYHRADDGGADLAAADAYLCRVQRATGGPNLGCGGFVRRHRRSRQPGGGRTTWTSPYQLARDLCLFTAVAANVQPIDTVFVNFRDAAGLRAEAMEAARDGFTGKMAIHPNQVEVINEVFTPRPEEIAMSEEIVQGVRRQPAGRRDRHSRADGRSRPHRPRPAHPRPRQGRGSAGVKSKARRYAGGGPNTRAAFRPVKPNEFDIV